MNIRFFDNMIPALEEKALELSGQNRTSSTLAVFERNGEEVVVPLIFVFDKYGEKIKAEHIKELLKGTLRFGAEVATMAIPIQDFLGEELQELTGRPVSGRLDCCSHGANDWRIEVNPDSLVFNYEVTGDDYTAGSAKVEIDLKALKDRVPLSEGLKTLLTEAGEKVIAEGESEHQLKSWIPYPEQMLADD